MAIDYTKYDTWDFFEDPSFIKYVKGQPTGSIDWNQWIQQHPEKKATIDEATSLIQNILVDEELVENDRSEVLLQKINSTLDTQQPLTNQSTELKVKRLWIRYAAAAAILLLMVTFIFWPKDSFEQIETQFAETRELILPDQSKIQLNVASVLAYNESGWAKERKVKLEGEAFFEVEKGAKFSVETEFGTVEVLGTSFNVLNRNDYFEVKCVTGRVKVNVAGHDDIILTPDEAAYYNNTKNEFFEKEFVNANQKLWTVDEIHFEDKPLNFVFAELEREFNIDINSNTDKIYNGSIQLSSLDSALYQICWPFNLKYSIDGKKVTIE